MLTIVLHNAALELVNDKICNIKHAAVLNDAKRRNKSTHDILLDLTVHQSAIYPDKLYNSGRPDLVHLFLLQYHHIMKLLPNAREVQLYVHTKNDEVFFVPQTWRVPVHFIRFRGLMEKFLKEKTIKLSESEELHLTNMYLSELVDSLRPDITINLTEQGKYNQELVQEIQNQENKEHIVVLIGGYQRGEIELSNILTQQFIEMKLLDEPTTAWMILNILFSGKIIEK